MPTEHWTRGGALTPGHRDRLLAAGALRDVLDGLALREVTGPLPDWWHENGNAFYLADDAPVDPELIGHMALIPFHDALVVLASDLHNLRTLLLGGDGAMVFVGPDSELTGGEIYCGARSTVAINGDITATRLAQVDARNGGSIVTDPGQLWAANVYVATDDMHRLEDATSGVRLNTFGAHIRLGRHVWLGRDVIVTGHVEVGDGSVVGMRSLVRNQKVPSKVAVAGTPARVIRDNVTWSEPDLP